MGLFLALAGAAFAWGLYQAWQKAEETRRWTPVPCLIISSAVQSERPSRHANIAHRAELRYRYHIAGQEKTGSKIKRVDGASSHEETARKVVEEFPVGSQATCYVNPANPDDTVLKHGSRAPLYSIWFPLLFVAGGLGMIWGALFRKRAAPVS